MAVAGHRNPIVHSASTIFCVCAWRYCSASIVEAKNSSGEQFGYESKAERIREACVDGLSAEATIDRVMSLVKPWRELKMPSKGHMAQLIEEINKKELETKRRQENRERMLEETKKTELGTKRWRENFKRMIEDVNQTELETKQRQENRKRIATEWAKGQRELPGKYIVSEAKKGEFFHGLGISESVFKNLISGSYRENEDMAVDAQRHLLRADIDKFLSRIQEVAQELLDCQVLKPHLACLEKDREIYPYDEDEDLERVFGDPEWVVKCISEAVGRTVQASKAESPKTLPSEVWELKGQYNRISGEIDQMGEDIAKGGKLNPEVGINHLQSLSNQLDTLSSDLARYGLGGFWGDGEPAFETRGRQTVFEEYRAPIVISLTLMQEITKILNFVKEEIEFHRERVQVNLLKSELDRAVIIVWEVISQLKKKPVAYNVAFALHYLGYEPQVPLEKAKDEDSTVNRWTTRYRRLERTLEANAIKLSEILFAQRG